MLYTNVLELAPLGVSVNSKDKYSESLSSNRNTEILGCKCFCEDFFYVQTSCPSSAESNYKCIRLFGAASFVEIPTIEHLHGQMGVPCIIYNNIIFRIVSRSMM